MSLKVVLVGILLLLGVPAASSAQSLPFQSVLFQITVSGTEYCHSSVTKFKGTLFFHFGVDDTVIIATDQQLNNVIATMQAETQYVRYDPDINAFAYTQDDPGGFGIFTGTYKLGTQGISGFKGNISLLSPDGCYQTATIKAKAL